MNDEYFDEDFREDWVAKFYTGQDYFPGVYDAPNLDDGFEPESDSDENAP